MKISFDFDKRMSGKRYSEFADILKQVNRVVGRKTSSRGWAYLLEQHAGIRKDKFDKAQDLVNKCRKKGLLPVDFVLEDETRAFQGVVIPSDGTVKNTLMWMLDDVLTGHRYFKPEIWEDEEYYIQMLVEKIDLRQIFSPVCKDYCIPIANSKGWSSISQRAAYARRFKEAQEQGLKCVLLYCGDHDPDGLRISEMLRKNLEDVQEIYWSDGTEGYDPSGLIIDRFGLNYDFIQEQGYSWIEGLTTGRKNADGSARDLSNPKHPNHKHPYVQQYLSMYGARKCEANAVVTSPDEAEQLCRDAIEKYLGDYARGRFKAKFDKVKEDYKKVLDDTGISGAIQGLKKDLDSTDED